MNMIFHYRSLVYLIAYTTFCYSYACQRSPTSEKARQLLHAVCTGNTQGIATIHQRCPELINAHIYVHSDMNLSASSSVGYCTTALIEATKARQPECVALLMRLGAQLSAIDSWGNSALYYDLALKNLSTHISPITQKISPIPPINTIQLDQDQDEQIECAAAILISLRESRHNV
jgi:hypothetical protein